VDAWLLITVLIGFFMAWNIGANDVANSMGTAVGAKAITPRQAAVIAGVMNFLGAYFFGKTVTNTIRGDILLPGGITDPRVVVCGSLAALLAAGIWLLFATRHGLPVSTTHAIIGGVVGYGLVYAGPSIVNWGKLTQVVASWILSPLLGAVLAYVLFRAIRRTLRGPAGSENAGGWASFWTGLAFVVIGTMFYIKVEHGDGLVKGFLLRGVPFGIAVFAVLYLLIRVRFGRGGRLAGVEAIFRRVQVVTSAYVALAHGSNDVANAIGPVAAVYAVISMGLAGLVVPVPGWILAMGGVGIAVGIFTYGYRVMETIGMRITSLNNTRGFSVDFSAATVILIASWLGLPVSTTHTVVGAVVGVGLARGVREVDASVLRDVFIAWFVTVPAAAGISALLFKTFLPLA